MAVENAVGLGRKVRQGRLWGRMGETGYGSSLAAVRRTLGLNVFIENHKHVSRVNSPV